MYGSQKLPKNKKVTKHFKLLVYEAQLVRHGMNLFDMQKWLKMKLIISWQIRLIWQLYQNQSAGLILLQ